MQIPVWFNYSSALLKNAGWMLLSEGVSRATRLLTIVAMATFLSGSEYGIAMLALACHELFRVFMRAGAGPKIIQCEDADLPALVGNGGVLQWIILLCLAAAQIICAPWLAEFYGAAELSPLRSFRPCCNGWH